MEKAVLLVDESHVGERGGHDGFCYDDVALIVSERQLVVRITRAHIYLPHYLLCIGRRSMGARYRLPHTQYHGSMRIQFEGTYGGKCKYQPRIRTMCGDDWVFSRIPLESVTPSDR